MVDGEFSFGDFEEVFLDPGQMGLQAAERLKLTADALRESANCLVLYIPAPSGKKTCVSSVTRY